MNAMAKDSGEQEGGSQSESVAIDGLVQTLSRMPGIGRRSAERIAVRLVSRRDDLLSDLVSALNSVKTEVRTCSHCGSLTTVKRDPCRLCTDESRNGTLLYVVEEPADVVALERSGGERGRYHVLSGRLSPMRGKGLKDLKLEELLERIEKEGFKEIVLALDTNVESDATASFISELLKGRKVKVSRLAYGLPVGSGVSYSDPVTLQRAIKGRQDV